MAFHAHVVPRLDDNKPPLILPKEAKGLPIEAPVAVPPRRKVERGRKNVSRACQACRQRRIRCSTERPCRPCQVNDIDCVDDGGPEGVDLRTIRLGPHNQKVFIQQKTLLDRLLRSIRVGTADDVLKCIQEGGSLSDLAQSLKDAESLSASDHSSTDTTDAEVKKERHIDRRDKSEETYLHNTNNLKDFGNLPLSSAIRTNGLSHSIQEDQIRNLCRSPWECVPLISDDASDKDTFSRMCFSFRNLARQQLANGASPALVLSLDGIELDLLFRERRPCDPHSVSTWACELLKTFDFLPSTVKIAGAEAVACLMRWLIAPTKENYIALPAASRPVASQYFVPHSIGIDIMIFPEIREALLARGTAEAWTSLVTPSTMDFSWPYSVDACLEVVHRGPAQEDTFMRLSRAFVEHIRDPNNLSLDRAVLNVFPEFEGKFRWHSSTLSSDSTAPSSTSSSTPEQTVYSMT